MNRLTEFINKTQMPGLGTLNTQILWAFGSVALTVADYQMLIWGNDKTVDAGLWLAGILVSGWTGKSVVGHRSNKVQRETSREYIKAQSDAKVTEIRAATGEFPVPSLTETGTVTEGPAAQPKAANIPDAYTDDERGD